MKPTIATHLAGDDVLYNDYNILLPGATVLENPPPKKIDKIQCTLTS
jgi:hypothetical protein